MIDEELGAAETSEPSEAHAQTGFSGDEWMTIDQVAEHFGRPAVRVREWISEGIFTPELSGSVERIKRSELDRVGNPDEDGARKYESEHGQQSKPSP